MMNWAPRGNMHATSISSQHANNYMLHSTVRINIDVQCHNQNATCHELNFQNVMNSDLKCHTDVSTVHFK